MLRLNGEQSGELTDLITKAFSESALVMLVRRTFGEELYKDYVGQGQPLREVVALLLVALEERGTTMVFLAGALKARPARADLKDGISRICPEALALSQVETKAQVAAVVASVEEVGRHIHDEPIRTILAASRVDLEHISEQIELLGRYKALHDCLHKMQLKHYRQIADAARRMRDDPLAVDMLAGYSDDLRTLAVDARAAAQGLPDNPAARGQELSWVVTLEHIVDALRTAVVTVSDAPAVGAVRDLKRVVRLEPSRINRLLTLTAQALPLSHLIDTLSQIFALPDSDAALSAALEAGLTSLRALLPNLMGSVAEHRVWQDVDNDLWQADDSLFQDASGDLEEVRFLWPGLKERVKTLHTGVSAELDQVVVGLDQSLPPPPARPDVAQARSLFTSFRRDAMYCFYLVDIDLKASCDEIIKIGQPLKDLLSQVPNDNG